MDIISYILSRKYTDNSIIGLGAIKGANCTVKDIVHQDGINTVTFEWEGTDGTKKTRDMIVYDGTPIYVWESGNTYHYGDLAIYESQFYRCIVENSDVAFDDTKWNEIGSPDGNYDLVQSKVLLPARFTAADRKLYYVIDEHVFYLWDGSQWVSQNNLVQLQILPIASAKYADKVYQYLGDTDATYKHGFLYQCINNGTELSPSYIWKCLNPSILEGTGVDGLILNNINNNVASGNCSIAQNDNTIAQGYAQTVVGTYNVPQGTANTQLPTDSAVIVGNGNSLNRSNAISIQWDGTVVFQDGSTMKSAVQHTMMPIATVDNLGQVIHYIGATNANYQSKHFYECISDGAIPPTYLWRDLGITLAFIGTQDEWDALTSAQQNQYDILNITDDEQVVDLGIYLRKVNSMPNAEDCPSEIVMYAGTTTSTYTQGYIYRSTPTTVNNVTTYSWVRQDVQPSHPYIQSDWSQNDSTANDYIKNKPTLGTASEKNYTSNVRPNNTDLVESQAVYSAINTALSSIYVPRGELSCAELTSDLLIPANVGDVYTMSDDGITSALFINGAGLEIHTNDNVGIIRAGEDTIMFNLMGNAFDLHDYQKQELTTPLTINRQSQTTVEDALSALNIADEDTYKIMGEMSAKNLIPIKYVSTSTDNLTFTVNNDGSINVNGEVTTPSTSSSYDYIDLTTRTLIRENRLELQAKSYTISLSGDNLDSHTRVIIRYVWVDGSQSSQDLISTPLNPNAPTATFTITQEQADAMANGTNCIVIRLYVAVNQSAFPYSINNMKCCVMLRHAEDTDDTWQPYAMTNYVATKNINELKAIPHTNGTGNNAIIENNISSNIASGNYSYASGYHTEASGLYSHVQNEYTIAQGRSQTVLGKYNIAQGTYNQVNSTDYVVIVGNGANSNNRSNALAVQWDGTVVFQDGSTQKTSALEKVSALPTASVTYLDKVYLLTATQTSYQKGGIYQCVSDGEPTPTYSWQLISSTDMVEFTAQELSAMW